MLDVKALFSPLLLKNLSHKADVCTICIVPRMRSGYPIPEGVSEGTVKMKAKDKIIKKFINISSASMRMSLDFFASAMTSICNVTATKIKPTRVADAEPVSM
ncbi:MAG: hypothetical protein WCP70_11770 [Methanothrix sp.]